MFGIKLKFDAAVIRNSIPEHNIALISTYKKTGVKIKSGNMFYIEGTSY